LLTITRYQAQRLRSVLRRAFGNVRGASPMLGFIANAEGLTVKSMFGDVAVEWQGPSVPNPSPRALWLPFQFLADCEAKNDDLVTIEVDNTGVTAQWTDRGVPQLMRYNYAAPPDTKKFPTKPAKFVENPQELLEAFTAATEICDPASARYALGHIQLVGNQGSIIASDGRQLLIQHGYRFPWTDDVLVPRSKVFALPAIPHDQPVRVGKTGDWVAIGIGDWTIYLAVNTTGKFPDILRCIPKIDATTSRCAFSSRDAEQQYKNNHVKLI